MYRASSSDSLQLFFNDFLLTRKIDDLISYFLKTIFRSCYPPVQSTPEWETKLPDSWAKGSWSRPRTRSISTTTWTRLESYQKTRQAVKNFFYFERKYGKWFFIKKYDISSRFYLLWIKKKYLLINWISFSRKIPTRQLSLQFRNGVWTSSAAKPPTSATDLGLIGSASWSTNSSSRRITKTCSRPHFQSQEICGKLTFSESGNFEK